MAFSGSIDGDHEPGNTRKRPEEASQLWLLALWLPLRRSSELPFRDMLYLRHHPEIVGAYANVKKALALVFGEDIAGYRNAKHPFIQRVMANAQAERDAAATH
jgi:GrpB protein